LFLLRRRISEERVDGDVILKWTVSVGFMIRIMNALLVHDLILQLFLRRHVDKVLSLPKVSFRSLAVVLTAHQLD